MDERDGLLHPINDRFRRQRGDLHSFGSVCRRVPGTLKLTPTAMPSGTMPCGGRSGQVVAVGLVNEMRDKGMPVRMKTYEIITRAFGRDALSLVARSPLPPESFSY